MVSLPPTTALECKDLLWPSVPYPLGMMVLKYWVAELKLSYYIGETLLFTFYTHYGNLIEGP